MKVRDLIAELQKLDPELLVIKQKDDEGNGFHKLYAVDDEAYIRTIDLDEYHLEVMAEDDIVDYYEEDLADFTRVCVIV